MRISAMFLAVLILAEPIAMSSFAAQKQLPRSPRILSAKTVNFDNQTGSDAVGEGAVTALKKWGKFQIVPDRKQADLIFLLSADPDRGGNLILSGGQTGSVENGHVKEDPIPNYNRHSRTRYAYLTVIDAKTGDNLWSEEHLWGGLVTGFNSVGRRLVKDLEKHSKK